MWDMKTKAKKKKAITFDGYAKRADDYFQEMVMLSHKVDRVERWVLQLAEKVGVQLKA